MIREIEFSIIQEIWATELWPKRDSKIEALSAIDIDLTICAEFMQNQPFHVGYFVESREKPIGVISGHPTRNNHFRIRGLWVEENYRRQKIGSQLVRHMLKQAKAQGCDRVWTLPRMKSSAFYETQGFEMLACTKIFEYGPHYLALSFTNNVI